MGIDIRLPLGLMFACLGLALIVAGFVVDSSDYQKSLSANVNLWWGMAMLLFGVIMFAIGKRGTPAFRTTEDSADGLKVEAEENRSGLESEEAN